jgi:ERF superfamily protein
MNAPAQAAEVGQEAVQLPLNIYQRINEVRKLCPYIQKDKKVDGAGYMAVTHDAVTAELRPHLIDQGIVILPRLISSHVADTGTTTKTNIPIIRYEAKYEIDFVNADNPLDRVTVPIESHALDQGDKAPGKAASYATKYAMLKLFSIETGEGEEERMTDAKAKQKKDLAEQITATNVTPTAGTRQQLQPEQLRRVERCASSVIDCFEGGYTPEQALAIIDEANFDADEKAALSTYFDSKQRTALRKARDAQKAQAEPTT